MSRTYTLAESASAAAERFHLFDAGMPDLIPTGITPVDEVLGGFGPGTVGILGMATGAGKSSLMLLAAMSSPGMSGIVSLEDPPDVIGGRVLAAESKIDSLRLRKKDLGLGDVERLQGALAVVKRNDRVRIKYCLGRPLPEVLEAIADLAMQGCRMVWIDYIQKIKGAASNDRRNEVSGAFTAIQAAAADSGVAVMVVSQFSRQLDPTKPPQVWWLKESGDLENEARLIVLGHRNPENGREVFCRVAKSTFGGEGTHFTVVRNAAGVLEYSNADDPFAG